MRIPAVVAALGIAAALAWPVLNTRKAVRQETAAAAWLRTVAAAEARFHTATGAYAASLESLVASCDGTPPPLDADLADGRIVASGHEIRLRPAEGATAGPPDCHGRPTTSDFYASARPEVMGVDGSRGMALTSAGRVFLFFDGVPPTEADMAAGLAMPLDALEPIP